MSASWSFSVQNPDRDAKRALSAKQQPADTDKSDHNTALPISYGDQTDWIESFLTAITRGRIHEANLIFEVCMCTRYPTAIAKKVNSSASDC